ncbi:MAG: SRPBCC domain-containing protein, partial [Myxococcales bacterium]|nr:SRPBCC domain-containing protein [Myxococcales bacterium]
MTQAPSFPRPLVEVTVAAPADEVWRALRDPARITQWFGWEAESLAAEIEHIFVQHALPDDAARVLRFDDDFPDWFEVEDRGATCVVRVLRPAPTADHDWSDVFEDMTQGWISFVEQLRFSFHRHAGAPRRTIYVSGTPHAGVLGIAALG